MKRLLISAFILLFLAFPAHAGASLEVILPENVLRETFYPGDYVNLTTTIKNNFDQAKNFIVEEFVLYPGIPPMPLMELIELDPGESGILPDLSFSLWMTMFPGSYAYGFTVYDENGNVLNKTTIGFQVQGTEKSFEEIEVLVCGDLSCNDVRRIFTLNDKVVYVRINSEENPETAGQIVHPDKVVEGLDFSDNIAEIKLGKTGLYELSFVSVKEGYINSYKSLNFSVMKEEPKIHYEFCNETSDNVCDSGCPYGEDPDCAGIPGMDYTLWIVVFLILVFIAVLSVFFMKRKPGA